MVLGQVLDAMLVDCQNRNGSKPLHPKKASDERLEDFDNYGYNQDVSRRLNVVSELLVTCELQTDLKAELCLEFSQVEWGYRLVLLPS